jgi:hypothetical protein
MTNDIVNLRAALEVERRERKEAEERNRAGIAALSGELVGTKNELNQSIRNMGEGVRKDLSHFTQLVQEREKATAATKSRSRGKGKGPQLSVVSDYPVDASAREAFGPELLTASGHAEHRLADASRNELRRWLRETWQGGNKAALRQRRSNMWGVDSGSWDKFVTDVNAAFEFHSQGGGFVVVRRKKE